MKTSTPQPGQKHQQAGRIWTVAGVFRSLVDSRTRVHLKSPQQPDRFVLVATLAFAYYPVRRQFVMLRAVATKAATSLTSLTDRRSV